MNDESKVWLVKTHSERDRSHQGFHFIPQQTVFQGFPLLCLHGAVIRRCVDASGLEPFRQTLRIWTRKRVNDAASRQVWNNVRKPSHALRLRTKIDVLET